MANMDRRIELHNKLINVLGSRNVYFQQPSKEKMKYPCIIYHKSIGRGFNADNKNYIFINSYDVKVIDPDPDSELPDKLQKSFSTIRRERPYSADGLYHYPFVLYF